MRCFCGRITFTDERYFTFWQPLAKPPHHPTTFPLASAPRRPRGPASVHRPSPRFTSPEHLVGRRQEHEVVFRGPACSVLCGESRLCNHRRPQLQTCCHSNNILFSKVRKTPLSQNQSANKRVKRSGLRAVGRPAG